MDQPKRKPTRRDLLMVIGHLQDLIGEASASHGNDRNPNGFERGQKALADAMKVCIEARSYDPPLGDSGPWSRFNRAPEGTCRCGRKLNLPGIRCCSSCFNNIRVEFEER